jgi:hypothetical protein
MPDAPVKELRLPELQLPEISRDEIMANLSLPKLDPTGIGKAVSDAASDVMAMSHLGPRRTRSRWPIIGGLVLAGLALMALVNVAGIRSKIVSGAQATRDKAMDLLSSEEDFEEPTAFDAAETMPLDPAIHPVDPTATPADYPAGLGADGKHGIAV